MCLLAVCQAIGVQVMSSDCKVQNQYYVFKAGCLINSFDGLVRKIISYLKNSHKIEEEQNHMAYTDDFTKSFLTSNKKNKHKS